MRLWWGRMRSPNTVRSWQKGALDTVATSAEKGAHKHTSCHKNQSVTVGTRECATHRWTVSSCNGSIMLSETPLVTALEYTLVLDLCGTFAFAVSGATAGVRRRLDLFGVLVLSFAASTFGGISRDVLIGATPPAAFQDWRYLAVAMAAGVITFYWSTLVERLRNPVRMLDAVGLAFFAVAGTHKALVFGLSPVMAALMGMLTGIGGGMARDILLAEVPAVLRSDLYAVAALAGSAI